MSKIHTRTVLYMCTLYSMYSTCTLCTRTRTTRSIKLPMDLQCTCTCTFTMCVEIIVRTYTVVYEVWCKFAFFGATPFLNLPILALECSYICCYNTHNRPSVEQWLTCTLYMYMYRTYNIHTSTCICSTKSKVCPEPHWLIKPVFVFCFGGIKPKILTK